MPAHRTEYVHLFGRPTDADRAQIAAFIGARDEHDRREADNAARAGVAPRRSAMLGVFCSSASVEAALETLKPELTPGAWDGLANALSYFRPKYDVVWSGGRVPQAFLDEARKDPGLARLEALLAKIVRFYDVEPLKVPPPRIALVPVPPGWGTHAEAMGNMLLLEIRSGDSLAEQASVVVHENAHFLWTLMPAARRQQLAAIAAGLGDPAERTYRLFHEAIPTALGQGVADRAFRPSSWSLDDFWYHLDDVDQCAKRIYPVVAGALDGGLTLDEGLIRRAIQAAETPP